MKKEYGNPIVDVIKIDQDEIFTKISSENDDFIEEPDNW